MADPKQKNRLGRGLAALIGEANTETEVVERVRGQRKVPIEYLAPNPANPRKNFDAESLDDLAQSVRSKGILQPILVRPSVSKSQAYEIIAGERRWRAAQRAGLAEVPIIVSEFSNREALEIAIIENVQRADLNSVEEARGYQKLADDFNYSQNDLAEIIGKSRSHVANTLRLLKLPSTIQDHIQKGRLTAGHARTLITSDNPEDLAQKIIEEGLTVRDAELINRELPQPDDTNPSKGKQKATRDRNADIESLEASLSEALGLKVVVSDKGGKGKLEIRYKTLEQLEGVCALIRPEGK